MPPVVTSAIVALIGLNLAPAAWDWVKEAPLTAVITIVTILVTSVLFRGMLGRLSICLIGVLSATSPHGFRVRSTSRTVGQADWVGLPAFHAPAFDLGYLGLFLPVVFVLIAENIGHVKSVSAMTGRDLDSITGHTLFANRTLHGPRRLRRRTRERRRTPRTSESWQPHASSPRRPTCVQASSP